MMRWVVRSVAATVSLVLMLGGAALPAAATDYTISAMPSDVSPKVKQRITIAGEVLPAKGRVASSHKVRVQQLRKGKWRTLKTVRIRADGSYSARVSFTSAGIKTLRVFRKRTSGSPAVSSPQFTVHVLAPGEAPVSTPAPAVASPAPAPAVASPAPAGGGTEVGGVSGPGVAAQWQVHEFSDGDACWDAATIDVNWDGTVDEIWFDLDNDCAWDTHVIDLVMEGLPRRATTIDMDEDQIYEYLLLDGDYNGYFDIYTVDYNDDGLLDTPWTLFTVDQSTTDLRYVLANQGSTAGGAATYEAYASVFALAGATGTAAWSSNPDGDNCAYWDNYQNDPYRC